MHFHALQEQKSETNRSLMQNVHVIYMPKFNVLSNGVIYFAVSLIHIMYTKHEVG
jgi:hypothetical protein